MKINYKLSLTNICNKEAIIVSINWITFLSKITCNQHQGDLLPEKSIKMQILSRFTSRLKIKKMLTIAITCIFFVIIRSPSKSSRKPLISPNKMTVQNRGSDNYTMPSEYFSRNKLESVSSQSKTLYCENHLNKNA